MRKTRAISLLLPALATGVLAALKFRHGLFMTTDSWAYWEGSVSLLTHHQYTYLGGTPIREWPPLFSLYLAAVQALAGVSGVSLIGAMSLLSSLCALTWFLAADRLIGEGLGDSPRGADRRGVEWAARALVCLSILAWVNALLAHLLQLALFPLALLAAMGAIRAQTSKTYFAFCGLAAWWTLLALLAHNTSLGIFAGVLPLLLFNARIPLRMRCAAAAGFSGLTFLPWLGVMGALGLLGSHPLGHARYGALVYLKQFCRGIGAFILPLRLSHIGFGLFCLLALAVLVMFVADAARRPRRERAFAAAWTACAALHSLVLLLVFNLTWINDPLNDRFLWFFPLTVFPLILVIMARRRLAFLLACAVLLAWPAAHTLCLVARGAIEREAKNTAFNPDILRPGYYLSEGRPAPAPWMRHIDPPTFPWIER